MTTPPLVGRFHPAEAHPEAVGRNAKTLSIQQGTDGALRAPLILKSHVLADSETPWECNDEPMTVPPPGLPPTPRVAPTQSHFSGFHPRRMLDGGPIYHGASQCGSPDRPSAGSVLLHSVTTVDTHVAAAVTSPSVRHGAPTKTDPPSLFVLPSELLVHIFVLAGNAALAHANRAFYRMAAHPRTRALWLMHKYPPQELMARAWRHRFMNGGPCDCAPTPTSVALRRAKVIKLVDACRAAAQHESAPPLRPGLLPWPCPAEHETAIMLGYLVALNCNVLGSKCAGMLYAAKRGHLALVQWWLDVGGDPEVVVQPSRRAKLVDSVRRWWRKHMLEIDETDPDAEWDEMSDVSIDTHTEAEPTPEVHAGGPVRGTAIATRLNPAGTPPSTLMASPERRAQSVRLASRADDLEAGLPDIDPGFDEQVTLSPAPWRPRWQRLWRWTAWPAGGESSVENVAPATLRPMTPPPNNTADAATAAVPRRHASLRPPGPPRETAAPHHVAPPVNPPPHASRSDEMPTDGNHMLLLQAVRRNYIDLVRILLSPKPHFARQADGSSAVSRIHMLTLDAALRLAATRRHLPMTTLLIATGARPSLGLLNKLLNRSGSLKMVVLGQSRADEPVLMALLAATPPSVWDRHQPAILRGVAEMGSVDCMRVCVRRGADINAWQGIVLSTAVYSGNIPLLRYLLAETGAETRHFGRTPMALVVALIAVESLAVLLYGLLLLIWVVSIVSLTFPENAIAAAFSLGAGIGVPELSIMAGLATLALGCMYRLVPLHGVARATAIITATKVERHHRAVERQRQNPPEAGEAGPAAGGEGARHHAADPATATRRLPMV
ncbi:hypothetical protein CXG81DRAFT_16881 [Caulochytrium protostelioides]|uniref:F-box domain-containing protein n=1 Tax=Caulochytrium protostelioides TaxID=1555241 RepID=A0A4P9XET2_9FUNG|nr:hypothetical protein CXG81DRAFT_16881 [Caulochytrium protostelioides]|eukprot:RKP03650.1 hypothetical protein CXG81DRAFT_16881 [Caulochytrium protostelioides]